MGNDIISRNHKPNTLCLHSCLQNSLKESERAHRSDTTRIDVVDLGLEFGILVDLKSF